MLLLTPVDIAPAPWSIAYSQRLLTLGSCFSDHIARCLSEYYFRVTANPFHTLYNPVSIAHHITPELMSEHEVVLVTFGTAWVYLDRSSMPAGCTSPERVDLPALSAVVDNCQRRPASDFLRYRLTVDDILHLWQPILQQYPQHRFVFTVSPIRHRKDGMHANQVSKAILLQAVDALVGDNATYFPAYEILLDELRDYRFYADDMLHPSSVAVEYIFSRFCDTYFTSATRAEMQQLHALWLLSQHRPLHPDSPEAAEHQQRVEALRSQLRSQYSWL